MHDERDFLSEAVYDALKSATQQADQLSDTFQEFVEELQESLRSLSELWDEISEFACDLLFEDDRFTQKYWRRQPLLTTAANSRLILKHCYRTGFL